MAQWFNGAVISGGTSTGTVSNTIQAASGAFTRTATAIQRTVPFAVTGNLSAKNTGTGTCTVNLVDNLSGANVASLVLNGSSGAYQDFTMPDFYGVNVVNGSGTSTVSAWVGGNANEIWN